MQLTAWTFSKKHNSTAQPTGAGTVYTVALKEDCSVDNPVFILGTGITATINYCQALGHYYFIDNIVILTKDQVELHCSMDVLATYKTEIGNYQAFIERAASDYSPYIIDDAMSVEQRCVASAIASTALWTIDQTGCFVIRVVGEGESGSGITSYVVSASELSSLLSWMFDDGNFASELQDSVVKTFFNPFQYLVSVMWFPFAKNDIPGGSHTLHLGWWDVGSYKRMSTGYYYDADQAITLPTNYYSGDFRAYHPSYTELTMYLPGVGAINLDPVILSNGTLSIATAIDFTTGNVSYKLHRRGTIAGVDVETGTIASYSGQVGVPVPVGQINGVSEGLVSGAWYEKAVGALLSGLSSGDLLSPTISGAVRGVQNATSPSASILGNAGTMANIVANPRLITSIKNYGCGEFPYTVYGRPLCKYRTINSLSGFVKCDAASLSLAAPLSEINEVNNFLNTGFYYE